MRRAIRRHRADAPPGLLARWLPTALVTASCLLCAGLIAALIESYRKPLQLRVCTFDAAYTFVLNHGRITLVGPPSPTSAQAFAAARDVASGLRNQDFDWSLFPGAWQSVGGKPVGGTSVSVVIKPDTATEKLTDAHNPHDTQTAFDPDVALAALRSLHEPEHFLAAHVVLTERGLGFSGGSWFHQTYNELRLPLTPEQSNILKRMTVESSPIDSASRAAIIDQWHARLDRRSPPLPLWPLALATAAPATLWLPRRWRVHRRRQHCLCLNCGYNLL
jgi:hypothetical protein